ncbi:MAG: hypothetical protein ACTSVY_05700 [Candidatus Helarchaeota archaeon]
MVWKLIPKDHDFIKTVEGFYFCVIGYEHPEDRIISYLKYIPWKTGKWKDNNNYLKRVLRHYSASEVLKSFKHFKGNSERYVFKDSINDITFTAVPKNMIVQYYQPQKKIQDLLNQDKIDILQEKTLNFIKILSKKGNIPMSDFGITGSILLGIHDISFSDIDLTVHGQESSLKVEKVIKKEHANQDSLIRRISVKEEDEWIQRKILQYKLREEQVKLVYQRKWNMGYFNSVKFSIHPIKKENEINEKYGARKYKDKGFIHVRALIKDDKESIYLPCKYLLKDIEIINGPLIEDIIEAISFEGLYCFMARNGERVEIKGKLEKVITKNKSFHRIVIGSFKAKEQDYILPIDRF